MSELPQNDDRLGRWKIRSSLDTDTGGMGAIYVAEDADLGEAASLFALKVLRPGAYAADGSDGKMKELVERFEAEASILKELSHPGIVKLHGWGTDENGRHFLVMDLLDGMDLARVLKKDPFHFCGNVRSIVSIGSQVADAMDSVHRKDIIHRDLKPANLFLVGYTTNRQALTVKILDFGIARLGEQAVRLQPAGRQRTQMGRSFGTYLYMAPEQWADASGAKATTDIYALGCILYEMAAGNPIFPYTDLPQLMKGHKEEIPKPLSLFRKDVDPALDKLIQAMVKKSPGDRPQSMREVDDELRRVVNTRDGKSQGQIPVCEDPDLKPPQNAPRVDRTSRIPESIPSNSYLPSSGGKQASTPAPPPDVEKRQPAVTRKPRVAIYGIAGVSILVLAMLVLWLGTSPAPKPSVKTLDAAVFVAGRQDSGAKEVIKSIDSSPSPPLPRRIVLKDAPSGIKARQKESGDVVTVDAGGKYIQFSGTEVYPVVFRQGSEVVCVIDAQPRSKIAFIKASSKGRGTYTCQSE